MSTLTIRLAFGLLMLLAGFGLVAMMHIVPLLDDFMRGQISGTFGVLVAMLYTRIWRAAGSEKDRP